MRVIHLLRKYDPAEWGGTESAVQRLFEGLRECGVTPVMYCPRIEENGDRKSGDKGRKSEVGGQRSEVRGVSGNGRVVFNNGYWVKRFRACVPIWGISREYRRQLVAVGGNLMSFDLLPALLAEREAALMHTHTLGRLGSIASAVAGVRHLPFVISVHGGLFDLPEAIKDDFERGRSLGCDWGRVFGALLKSRDLLSRADAVFTCNPKEAELIRERYPDKRVQVQPHGIETARYLQDQKAAAREAYPQLRGRQVLLCVGRIDPVKNQGWVVAQTRAVLQRHPDAAIVLAGPCTYRAYGEQLERQISDLGLENKVVLTGGLPPADPRLIGLLQLAEAVVLPSVSETFGLVLLEAWAAGTPVISSRTSGATSMIKPGANGWLFDLNDPATFHQAVDEAILRPGIRTRFAAAGRELVMAEYEQSAVGKQVKRLYEELIEEKHALCHSTR